MATTTASVTLSSSDLLTDNLSLSSTMSLYKGDTTATGLEQLNYHRAVLAEDGDFDLIPESAALTENANYVYIANKNTDATHYCIISINSEVIGRLYAGDWLWMPWDCDLTHATADSSIEIIPKEADATVEYALFHSGETLVTSSD
jgi:hypothetical protein